MSYFTVLDLLPDDPILSLPILFNKDPRQNKANLGVGAYRTSVGAPYVLDVVQKAEASLLQKRLNKEYLPIEGDQEYCNAALHLILGSDNQRVGQWEVFAAQMVGGSGALRIGAAMIGEETKKIFIPEPSWPNHRVIFTQAGLCVEKYPYYDESRHALDFDETCASITNMPPGSCIVLHTCCHNPTGTDPSEQQWQLLSKLIREQRVIPFFDFAYQGFGDTLEQDAYPVRLFAREGHEMLVATSFSKNLGLYSERVGLLVAFTHGNSAMNKVKSHIKYLVRSIYSTPPAQGARIVKEILLNDELYREWVVELEKMRGRVKNMRGIFASGLTNILGKDYSFVTQQKGMFCFCGLTKQQSERLKTEHGIYLPDNGRVNVAALTEANIPYVLDAIKEVSLS